MALVRGKERKRTFTPRKGACKRSVIGTNLKSCWYKPPSRPINLYPKRDQGLWEWVQKFSTSLNHQDAVIESLPHTPVLSKEL